jgi:hypothetical protein
VIAAKNTGKSRIEGRVFKCSRKNQNAYQLPADFRLTDQLAGWIVEEQYGYVEYDVTGLYNCINGAATAYENQGMQTGIAHQFKSTEARLSCYVMDFGTESNADNMFKNKKETITYSSPLDGYAESIAICDTAYSQEIQIYSHRNNFYFEIRLVGDNSAKETAKEIIDYYFSIIDNFESH